MALSQDEAATVEEAAQADEPAAVSPAPASFDEVYDQYFDFVWRSARRLGVPEHAVDDAVQDVFVVVHNRLADFEGRSSIKTWLFGIVRRVVRDHRPDARRAEARDGLDAVAAPEDSGPLERAARAEAARLLHELLDALDDDKREAFILADLEGLSVPEVAESLGVNVNTVYARVRAARREMEQALARVRARQAWRRGCPS